MNEWIYFRVKLNYPQRNLDEIEETDGDIEIELSEDIWEKTCSYDWQVKYFWMKLLKF